MKPVFDSTKPIDDSNFLEYRIRRLRTANSAASYREGIDNLVEIGEVLKIIDALGRIQEIGNRGFYIEALRWLKGETELNNWHHVPHVPSLEVMTIEIANAFRLYTDQLKINLRAETLYSQVEMAMKVAPIVKAMPVSKRLEQAIDKAQDQISNAVSEKILSIQATAGDFDEKIRNVIEGTRTTAETTLQNQIVEAYRQIDQRVQNAMSQVQQATALREWGTVYDLNIAELTLNLHGKTLVGSLGRNINALKDKFKNLSRLGIKNVNWVKLILKIFVIIFRNIWSLATIINSKLFSIAGKRSISFLLLSLGGIAMVVYPILEILGIVQLHIFNPKEPTEWLTKIVIFLPLVIILSISYSFSTKNYRIYANMLDQYKHRRAVAKTAQGIILSIDASSEDTSIRDAMTASAATALFEHKVTGHLSKKEVESLGFLDLLRSVGTKT